MIEQLIDRNGNVLASGKHWAIRFPATAQMRSMGERIEELHEQHKRVSLPLSSNWSEEGFLKAQAAGRKAGWAYSELKTLINREGRKRAGVGAAA